MVNLKQKDKERLDYEIRLKKKDECFNLFISELKILGKGKTLDEAYKNLLDKKEDIVREFEELGILDELPDSSPRKGFRFLPGRQSSFFVKTLLVAGMVVLVMGIGFKRLEGQAISLKQKIPYVGAIIFEKGGRFLDRELQKAADRDMSPEKQKEIANNVRVLVQRYKPIFDELTPLFSRSTEKN